MSFSLTAVARTAAFGEFAVRLLLIAARDAHQSSHAVLQMVQLVVK